MNNLIYFPSFEPPSQSWLKFALLYLDNFNPIIPDSGRQQLSTDYQMIMGETDLVIPFKPNNDQGDRASLKAIEFIDKVRGKPYSFTNLFNKPNLIRTISNKDNRNFKIYGEKFSMEWQNYCISNNFGENTVGGIRVTQELAFIYMTFLAEEIAFETGKSIITDNNNFDNFLNYQKSIPKSLIDKQNFAQGILDLKVPKGIATIPIKNLIKFRNSNRDKIKAFNTELTLVFNNIEAGISKRDFVDSFNNIYKELTIEILAQAPGIISVPLATYVILHNVSATMPEYMKEIMSGISGIVNAKVAVGAKWKEIANKRKCRRYLTNLEQLA
jgi:hypothetical protein